VKRVGRIRIFIALSLSLALQASLPAFAADDVPAPARERFQAGVARIDKAADLSDFLAAMDEFEAAAAIAPKWPDLRYNLALLAAGADKPAKAIKEYRAYLELQPAAADRKKVEDEIARLIEHIARKRKIGLPGVTFAAMADGIRVLQILPGARIQGTGRVYTKAGGGIVVIPEGANPGKDIENAASAELQPGDRIVGVDGKPIAGGKIEELFRAIEASTLASEKPILNVRNAKISRLTRGEGTGRVVVLDVERGKPAKAYKVFCTKEMFRSRVVEIEEDEFDEVVLKADLPVVATFWNGGCERCRETVPAVDAESVRYADRLRFVNVNTDMNRKLVDRLGLKDLPTVMVFRGGKAVSVDAGAVSKEKVRAILAEAAR
jgi:thioredoxin 1